MTENDSYNIPADLREAIDRYVDKGIPPGHFLQAVLSNDLVEACKRADAQNKNILFEIVAYLYNYVPANCWGSEARYRAWLAGFERQNEESGINA